MKAHTYIGSTKLILIALLLLGGLTVSAVTYADSILPAIGFSEGSLFSALSRTGPTTNTAQVVSEPSVTTDKDDYSPGEVVQISGSGFRPNEMVTLQIVHIEPTSSLKMSINSTEEFPHSGHEPWDVMVNADGTFSATWLVEPASLNQTLLLTADQPARDGLPALHAETTFTDGQVGTYDQCSNDEGEGYDNPPGEGCKWIFGNLNGNNSTYPEGTATVQRAELVGFGPDEYHSVTFQYGTTKNGKHAYDFLTGWDWSEKWITVEDRCEGIDDCEVAAEVEWAIPADPYLASVTGGGWEVDSTSPTAPDTPHRFVMRGATFEKLGGGNPISDPTLQDPGMTYAGTSETLITVYFKTPPADSPMCETSGGRTPVTTCRVALWFGAHVAKGVDWLAENGTTGAGSISGSPYHVALFRLDDLSIGNRDNQMQAGAVTSQSLEVVKVLSPTTDPGRFDLLIDPGPNQFEAPNQGDLGTTGAQEVQPGTHTVSEAGGDTPPTDLNNYTTTLSCQTTASNGQVSVQNFGDVTGNPSRQVAVPENGDVVCTYTNTARTGSLQIVKETDGGIDGKDYDWFFSTSGFNGNANIELNTNGIDGTDSSDVFSNLLSSGDYDVAEIEASNPAGWSLTGAVCKIGDEVVDGPTNIEIRPNQLTICTFTNEEDPDVTRGRIKIDKVTNPSGDDQVFTFDPTNFNSDVNIELADETDPFVSELLVPTVDTDLTYSVSEMVPAGWVLTSATCDNGSPIEDIVVNAGETVTCTFNNSRPDMTISITPEEETNEVGDAHVFTVTVTQSPNGADQATTANITWDVDPDADEEESTCDSSVDFVGLVATCTITINNNTAGTFTANATAVATIDGVELTRTTDGTGGNSGPATKHYVDARISLTPLEATNDVGDPHVITAKVEQNTGEGWVAVEGATVNFELLNNTITAAFVGDAFCTTNASGECSITISASSVGGVDIQATTTIEVNGESITRTTGVEAQNSANAHKDYVSGYITIEQDAVNEVGDPHTFTITVTQDPGNATPATEANITFDVEPDGAYVEDTCSNPVSFNGSMTASCTVTVSSNVVGTVTVNASTTFNIEEAEVSRTTDGTGSNSDAGVKKYVSGTIQIGPPDETNNIGEPHTFTVTVTQAAGTATPKATSASVVVTFDPDITPTESDCDADVPFVDDVATCSVTINSYSPGVFTANATAVFTVAGVELTRTTDGAGGNSGAAIKRYVAGRIIVKKETEPNGSTAEFDFTASYDDDGFSLSDGESDNSGYLAPGNYSVAETLRDGWELTSATCDDGSDPASIDLEADETVTCTFTNTYQPSITIDKTGDALSKIGDDVNYTITVTNTSTAGTGNPSLECEISDPLLDFSKTVTLAPGAQDVSNVGPFTIPADADDPFINTASVSCTYPGSETLATSDTDDHSTNLFQPGVDLEKTGPAFSKAGDTAVYTINIENTSSSDSPNLILDSLSDTLAGDLKQKAIDAGCDDLASGGTCQFNYDYVVQEADPDPLENTATVHYHPEGFPNDITDSDTYSTDLLHPAFNVTKVCKAEPVLRAGPAVFTITFNNTGDADLHVVPSEGDPFDVAAGESRSYDYSVNGPFTANVSNTVTGTVTLAEKYDLENSYNFEESDTCDVNGLLIVQKTTVPAGSNQVFSISASGTGAIVGGGAGSISDASDHTYEVNPGTYDVTETVPDGWAQTGNTCDDVVVPAGETRYCLITNTKLPKLIVKKIVITPEPDIDSSDFTMQVNSAALTPNPTEFDGSEAGVTTYFPPSGGSYNVTEVIPAEAGPYQTNFSEDCEGTLEAGDEKTCTVTNVYLTGFVTSSSLCTFDVDPNRDGAQFRLIYTPDQSISVNKLNASNPGQFFYNVLHYNDPEDPTDNSVTLNIPYPFVTHGATPVHVYSDVEITQNGETCLIPGSTLAGYQYTFGLGAFGVSPVMGDTQKSVTVNDLPEGFSYINIHLDYGLKKTTGYSKTDFGGDECTNDANQTLTGPDIPDCQSYHFSNGGDQYVESINNFKKNPGVGGLNLKTDEMPVSGARMELRNARGQLLNSQPTDEDGWYFLSYKHTGKAADFIIVWVGSGLQKKVTLKANGMMQVDFP
jgi:uncharacterized repeat protein (TIGR01451 family)